MLKFNAHLGFQFNELPFLQRIEAAAAAGFRAVEFPSPYAFDASLLADHLAQHNLPLIQLLNKSRGAKNTLTLAAQTLPDFIARMGNEARARQILGNCNNLIALRTKDRQTQDFIVETFGQTEIQVVSKSVGSGNRTEDHGIDFTTNVSYSLQEKSVDIFAPELLGMLQNLHYIAFMSGGRLIKGRLPKLLNS